MYVSHSVTEIEQCCIFIRVFCYLLCIKHFYCFYKVRGCVVNLVGHGSCIMGHASVFVWVSGSWVTACDPLFTLVGVPGSSAGRGRTGLVPPTEPLHAYISKTVRDTMFDSTELRGNRLWAIHLMGSGPAPHTRRGKSPYSIFYMRCAAISATAVLLLILSDKVQA